MNAAKRNRIAATYNDEPDEVKAAQYRGLCVSEALGEMSRWALYPGHHDANELPESIDPRKLAAFVRELLSECQRLAAVNEQAARLALDNRTLHASITAHERELTRLRAQLAQLAPAPWDCPREQYDAHHTTD